MAMTKRERVLAALRGDRVDRVPLSFWLHNFVTENSAAALAAAVGPDTPIIWTIFAPMMVMPSLLAGGREQALAIARAEPKAMDAGLAAIAETLAAYARACVEAGADGLFYATNIARGDGLTTGECRRYQRPHDLRVLGAVAQAPFNLLHVCGPAVHFDEFA